MWSETAVVANVKTHERKKKHKKETTARATGK